jgi:hypothetical protein
MRRLRRFGTGACVPAGVPNPFARRDYLDAVTRCVPAAVRTLAALDVTDYAEFSAGLRPDQRDGVLLQRIAKFLAREFDGMAFEEVSPRSRLRLLDVALSILKITSSPPTDYAALQGWAARWGFTDAWALETAGFHARYWWAGDPGAIGLWLIHPVELYDHRAGDDPLFLWSSFAGSELVFPPGPSWNPIEETDRAFRARVEAYIGTIKASPAIQPTPTKQQLGGRRHFEWTALYHCGGRTLNEIVELSQETHPDEFNGLMPGTVSEAIKSVADLVGLTLQPRQGQPKKT